MSDQWSTYGTKQIVPTAREGHDTLDELLGNATDTHGATLVNSGLFDIEGRRPLRPTMAVNFGSPAHVLALRGATDGLPYDAQTR
ncbi:hypothetical protein ABZ815_37850 [Nonomuraea sp. NPDC047529]|uniref:hypothetical protein n=1 Tax=Nonomuraea sp. NPDC047529 TaxID=3155623 RepID=UPI0033DF3F74